MNQKQSITSLPESPQDDQRRRVIRYSVAMSIRVACVIACFFAQGWWLLACVIGALVLPYIAVVIANVGGKEGDAVERPGSILPVYRAPGAHHE
ncbi:DUF3099 domain-containing protein [Salinibacterium sp. G-O1]|uniref:DUF3099 domain-containing protein n=1 Tax=Salinibacterium sp. G-O1 TaxID=3046208 RepID=UPI0024BB5157|nr:DUF3099 domain-containing protein [Salinibacterium sp. G-O1]MDJ0335110.1 DUF3099 domain-containing protein [Salinibacterium sp. G-O1]